MRRLGLSHAEFLAMPDGYDEVAFEVLREEDDERRERQR